MKNEATEKLTEISAKQWDFVTQDNLSAKEAVAFLINGMKLRTFAEILHRVCARDDIDALEKEIINGLCEIAGNTAQPDSIRRKVRNWVSGKNLPTEREDVFKICFSLGLDVDSSDRMLSLLTEQGIHYRNGREIIYAYALRYKLSYAHAQYLISQYFHDKEEKDEKKEPMTEMLRESFKNIRAEEDLFSFILRHKSNLGKTHNTAYSYFTKMLSLLTGEELEGEDSYSMEYVADTYLRLNVPNEKNTSKYSDVQKMVKKYWPGAKSVKAMKARSEDVSRKALLLMYIVTGGVFDEEYDELDEAYIEPKEFLEIHCRRMNKMLMECGMSRIDPRNAFDYLVLYCLRPEDELFMSDRMAELASEIFGS